MAAATIATTAAIAATSWTRSNASELARTSRLAKRALTISLNRICSALRSMKEGIRNSVTSTFLHDNVLTDNAYFNNEHMKAVGVALSTASQERRVHDHDVVSSLLLD
jgi:hypothetical protein